MNRQYFLAISGILALVVFVVGCQQQAPETTGQIISESPIETNQTQPQPPPDLSLPPEQQQPEAIADIYYLSSPTSAETGENVVIEWKVDSNVQKNITHTAVHYGNVSYPGMLSTEIAVADSGYAYNAGLVTSATIPDTFSATIKVPETATRIYYRAHAIVDGKNYWSEEKTITVSAPEPMEPPQEMPAPPAPPMGGGGGY